TKGVFLSDQYFEDRLIHATHHLKGFRKLTGKNIPENTLELGTGWYPVVPVSLFLSGVSEVCSIDISKLTNKERLITTLMKFKEYLNDPEKKKLFSEIQINQERLLRLSELTGMASTLTEKEITDALHLRLEIINATNTGYPEHTFDLVHSNNTFEHIYPEVLKKILFEFNRITRKKTGVNSHFIDMSDHFAHFDTSISIYNFLKFSESQWKWIDNSIQPLNRLRFPDYIQMYRDLNIPVSYYENRPGDITQVRALKIDSSFKKYNPEELAISHSHIYSLSM
ncbi:MAG: class I SAM-dependent methyltransferase, partial [Bacteroidia bacterium]|nr:class I SAM-dependent methyltransferase [Bacteroidia bacterium]